jgi:alpha-N-arabinofuranosidase
MKPVLAVYAAYSMRSGAATNHMDECIQDALDEIEYVTGETTTQWGAQRERDGHKKPFDLEYVEVGNEDNLGSGGRTYNQRFTAFHDAIKAKYPNLKLISTATSGFRPPLTTTPDVIDDHYYRTPEQLAQTGFPYDRYSRTLPKIFVGEYASQTPGANRQTTPCLADALGDAAFLTSLERNSDVVIMSSYAPLFVNINPGGTQWQTDLIGYDALSSYGSPSYYVQKIFNLNHGDTILNVSADHMPTYTYTPPAPRARRGGGAAREPQPIQIPTLHFGATRDRRSGLIYLKIVNPTESEQSVDIKTTGVSSIAPSGKSIVITGTGPLDTNAINDPVHIVPVTTTIKGVAADFTRTLPPYSATVLVYRGR